ncbi:DUF469 family protein, partial [Providencia rettgeri]|nr:DUF469 family protein [Providencia rettgeri]
YLSWEGLICMQEIGKCTEEHQAIVRKWLEARKLEGYLSWEGLICMQEIGKCTEEHQAIVRKWLEARKLEDVRTSELFDVWWD